MVYWSPALSGHLHLLYDYIKETETMNFIIKVLLVLFLTIIIEFTVYWIFIRKEPLKLFFYALLINFLTFPLANYGYQYVLNNFVAIEIIVIFIESVVLFLLLKQKYLKSLWMSMAANLVTALLSFLL